MKLDLPDDILHLAQVTRPEVHLLLAIQLYGERRLDYHQALRLAEVTASTFNRELTRRSMSIQVYPQTPDLHVRRAG